MKRWRLLASAGLYAVFLLCYTIWSYGLTPPNLFWTQWAPYVEFQMWMWQSLYDNRTLLTQTYVGIQVGLVSSFIWLAWELSKTKITRKLVFGLLLLFASLVLFASQALSYDVFNYAFNAKMVVEYQANPHVQTALEFPQEPWLKFMHNVHTPAPYWYGWTAVSLVPYLLSLGKISLATVIFRVLNLGFLLLLSWFLLKRMKTSHWWGFVTIANPFVLIETIGNTHNDIWMITLGILAVSLASQAKNIKQTIFAVVLWLLSISLKLATVAVAPIILSFRFPSKFPHLQKIVTDNWALFSSIAMFLPLLTARSKQFLPWYLLWSLLWIPLIKGRKIYHKVWISWLFAFAISSSYRYVPFLWHNGYSDLVINQQLAITWLGGIVGTLLIATIWLRHTTRHV